MKGRLVLSLLVTSLVALPILGQEATLAAREEARDRFPERLYPIMRPDARTRSIWHLEQEVMPEARIDAALHYKLREASEAGAAAKLSLLPFMGYTPSKWSQGACGDCWIWGSTAAASIASGVHTGNPALFSIQYMNSKFTASNPCCGGTAGKFAAWYAANPYFVPWSNTNAAYVDGARNCGYASSMPASPIATHPKVAISGISATSVTVRGVPPATAIANIKNVLNQTKAIAFSYMLPTASAWSNFSSFWNNSSQDTPWSNVDKYSGLSWDSGGGGHLVCLVGYDDEDGTWILLNSWGARTNRPAGTFKIPQAMNYGAYYVDGGHQYPQFYFNPFEITWPESPNTVVATITTPSSNVTLPTGATQAFVGTATTTSTTATLSYSWQFGDGSNAVGAHASHTFTNTTGLPVNYTVTLTAVDSTGAKGTATRVVTVNPSEPIKNGGFEQGAANWTGHTTSIGASSGQSPYAGVNDAWLGGYGKVSSEYLAQTTTIPASGGTLSFYLHVDTAETTTTKAYDTLQVQVCNPAGAVLGYVTYSNLNRSTGYVQKRVDLSSFKGQTVQIRFMAKEDASLQTSFVLDNVSLN